MNRYKETTTELFDLQKFAIKLGLENITLLAKHLGNPHLNYPVIHIAGTNGKGSTAFFLAQIFESLGLKTGLFTSPHLKDFRERIRVNGQLISEEAVIAFWETIKPLTLELKATFFDTTTALGFKYFSDQKVDVAIIETGLGGRLDSTNIVHPFASIITPISYDHQKHLGNTLAHIASEKAGIIKKGRPLFIGNQVEEVLATIKSKANKEGAELVNVNQKIQTDIITQELYSTIFKVHFSNNNISETFQIPTPASYQIENIALALVTAQAFCAYYKINFELTPIKKRLSQTVWPGRMEIKQKDPTIIFDVSHNFEGIKTTVETLLQLVDLKSCSLVLGIVNDKDAEKIVSFLNGKFKEVVVTEPQTERKQEAEALYKLFKDKGQKVKLIKDLHHAYESTKDKLKNNEVLIVMGSHYLVGAL